MSYSRVLCYPVKALGSVTINGSIITRGETIQQFGELRIDLGTYRQDDIVLYNDAIKWSPVSVEGNVLVFNMQSNGKYFMYDNARKIVFDFTVNIGQDFIISEILRSSNTPPYPPTASLADGRYWQGTIPKSYGNFIFYVKSSGADISELALSSSKDIDAKVMPKDPSLGNDYLRVYTDLSNIEVGESYDVKVGNVLVAFITLT